MIDSLSIHIYTVRAVSVYSIYTHKTGAHAQALYTAITTTTTMTTSRAVCHSNPKMYLFNNNVLHTESRSEGSLLDNVEEKQATTANKSGNELTTFTKETTKKTIYKNMDKDILYIHLSKRKPRKMYIVYIVTKHGITRK